MSCLGFRLRDSLLNALHVEASSECTISSESKTSVIRVLSLFVRSSGSSIFP